MTTSGDVAIPELPWQIARAAAPTVTSRCRARWWLVAALAAADRRAGGLGMIQRAFSPINARSICAEIMHNKNLGARLYRALGRTRVGAMAAD